MATKAKSADETSSAQGRFVISLDKSIGEQIDKLATRMADKMRQDMGVGVTLTRPQIVTSLVTSALAALDDLEPATASEASTNGDAS